MRGLDVRNKRDVHVHHILRADFEDELPDRFEKWKTFNVSGRTADFRDHHVIFAFIGKFADPSFDHVGYMRNYLHSFAEIITATLF